MMTDTRVTTARIVVALLVLFAATSARAFQGFDDGGGGGLPDCATCHGALANTGPGNAVHDTHAAPAAGCSDCHGGAFDNPPLDNCVQCHGRDADAGGDGVSAGIGRGLRQHHETLGVAACGSCHSDSLGAAGVGEHVLPSFYTQALGGAGLDSCDGSEERFASQTVSLDNDGDGLTDGNDPDCAGSLAPTADAAGPYGGNVGTAISFDGTGSADPDGTIASYAWDFGDGGTASGPAPSHSYAAEGTFTVTLTVTDNDGLTGVDATTASVSPAGSNSPPLADAGGPYIGYVGESITLDGSASADPDGAIVRYDWDFGDGTVAADAGPAPAHVYAAAGEFTLTLTVVDDTGDAGSAAATATITERGTPTDGETQYNSFCASCHGDPWVDPPVDPGLAGAHRVAGARSCSIEASIFGTEIFPDGAPGMQFLQDLVSSGTVDARQIAGYLNSQSVTGEQRYVAACAGCHGDDGSGGRTREGVRGEDAHETWEAIREEHSMRFLECLPDADVESIAAFLGGNDGDHDDDDEEDEDEHPRDTDSSDSSGSPDSSGSTGPGSDNNSDDSTDGGGGSGDLPWLLLLGLFAWWRTIGITCDTAHRRRQESSCTSTDQPT